MMGNEGKARRLGRSEMVDLSRRYGLKAALFGAAAVATTGVLPPLADFVARDARAQAKAKYRVRFGSSVINQTNDKLYRSHIIDFARKAEELTDGELHIQVIDSGGACAETACGDKVANGVLDMGSSSTQNLGTVFPYTVAIDFPFMWDARAGFHSMFCDPEMNDVYRDVLRSKYGIEPLFLQGDLRDLMLGKKYDDAPLFRSPAQLKGAKVRITNSELIRQFAATLDMNPIPLAWTELLEGLKSGVVDAAETWPTAAAGGGMTKVIAQDVGVGFCPGCSMVFMSSRTFETFPDRMKEQLYEAGRQSMEMATASMDDYVANGLGIGPAGQTDGMYREHGVRYAALTPDERQAFVDHAGAKGRNGAVYDSVRKQLEGLAGQDVYGKISAYADRVAGKPFEAKRWWA